MKNLFLLLLFVTFVSGVAQNIASHDTVNVFSAKYNTVDENLKPIDVTIDELKKSPEKYFKKYIRVSGFLDLDLTNSALYKTEEDYRMKKTENAILYVSHKEDTYLLSQRFNKQFAIVSGTFQKLEYEKYEGGIFWIQRIETVR